MAAQSEDSRVRQVCRKVLGGYFGGLAMGAVAHPFDTIKSRVQSGTFPTVRSCISSTAKNEGLLAFYKGVVPPVATCGIYNATMFSFNEFFKSLFTQWSGYKAEPGVAPPLWLISSSAIATAPFACLVFVPAEVVKIRLQLQQKAKAEAEYRGVVDCLVKTTKQEGPSALLRGYLPTLGTRVVGLPFFFGGNELGKNWIRSQVPGVSDFTASAFGGMCAGVFFWSANYPFDLVKTRTQGSKGVSPLTIAKQLYATNGVRAFYLGFSACMLRAIPANTTLFIAQGYADRKLKENGI